MSPWKIPREIQACPQCGGFIMVKRSHGEHGGHPFTELSFSCTEGHDLNLKKDVVGGVVPCKWTEACRRIVDWIEQIDQNIR